MSTVTTISKGDLSASISSEGAELRSLSLGGTEYLWQRDPQWWAKAAPVLFPVVGAPGHDELASEQGTCRVPKHGFARDYEHELVGVSEDGSSVTYEFRSSDVTREMYPYDFSFRMTYAITDDGKLAQTFRVENTGEGTMPFSIGGHPAFNVPVPGAGDEAFEDYEVRFDEAWTADSPKMLDGGVMSYADPFHVLVDTDVLPITRDAFAFDTVVLRDVPASAVTLVGTKSGHGVRVEFPGFDFIGIWSAQPDAPFVALEPWTGHAALDTEDNVFEHRDNITLLAPGEVLERTFTVKPF